METLAVIAEHPARRAGDLADIVGRERDPFKLDVRKLKNLGLTLSASTSGTELSPRGQAYRRAHHPHLGARDSPIRHDGAMDDRTRRAWSGSIRKS